MIARYDYRKKYVAPEQDDYDPWDDPGLAFTNEEFSNFDYGLAATDGRIFYLSRVSHDIGASA